jgi:site-specific DNA recombinase
VGDVLIEKQTAKVPGRPIFNAMLDRIEVGEASGILAWHPDRLSRNSLDGGRIIYLVDTRKITDLKFPTFVFDPSPSGKFMLSIMFGQSKYYVDSLSENIKRGQRQKVRNGIWPLLAPVGYLNDRQSRTIYPDPHRAPLIRAAFELYASGDCTLDRLVQTVNAMGLVGRNGECLSRSHYHRILQHSIYCGIIHYSGENYEGTHQPIISKKLFDDVQKVIGRRSRPTGPKRKPYLYRGVFRCGECGCFITTETQKGHNYLRCTKRVRKDCSQPYLREESVAQQIADYLLRCSLPDSWADAIIGELETERTSGTASRRECLKSLRSRIGDADAKLERLMQAYLDKTLSLDEYREVKNRIIEEKHKLKEELNVAEENRGDWFEPAISFVKAAKQAGFLTSNASNEQRLDFFKKIGSNPTISNRHLSIVPRGPWQLVVDQGPFAQHNAAPAIASAALFGPKSPGLNTAERAGFEPARRFKPPTAFPVLLLQPLGHLSKNDSPSSRSANRWSRSDGWRARRRGLECGDGLAGESWGGVKGVGRRLRRAGKRAADRFASQGRHLRSGGGIRD